MSANPTHPSEGGERKPEALNCPVCGKTARPVWIMMESNYTEQRWTGCAACGIEAQVKNWNNLPRPSPEPSVPWAGLRPWKIEGRAVKASEGWTLCVTDYPYQANWIVSALNSSTPQPPKQPSTEGKGDADGILRSTQEPDQPRTGVNAEVGAATEPPERPDQAFLQINPVPSAAVAKGIAARAWCHEKNAEKPMDPDLAEAFAIEMICWNAEMRDNLFASLEAGAKVAAEEIERACCVGFKMWNRETARKIILRHLSPKETK